MLQITLFSTPTIKNYQIIPNDNIFYQLSRLVNQQTGSPFKTAKLDPCVKNTSDKTLSVDT